MQSNNQKKSPLPPEEIPTAHWADHAAEALLEKHPDKATLVCASGISPSGMVHIGNFREVITVEFVVRALRDRGRNVRFIYSWDDYDAFRKVPANLPQKAKLESHLREPISQLPDPFDDGCSSYAAHFEKIFEREIAELGVQPEYIRQNEPYRAGKYAAGIREALAGEKTIIEILNRYRTEPLASDWTCVSVFCRTCNKDTTQILRYEPPSTLHYRCEHCKADAQVNFETEPGVKLLWRVDWPMRWAREGVDFEPGGKDHSSTGGSYETGAEIIRALWKKEPPFYVQYDFVLAKGLGSKLSSSSGNLLTLGEALEIYEPQVIRWIFASRKPNLDFSIAFDLDVMKAYDDFDRCERFAFGREQGEEKKVNYERRIYEFASIPRRTRGEYGEMPAQFAFRHLCNILQIHQGDLAKTKQFFEKTILTPEDDARFQARASRAWKWITTFAPPEFKFTLRAAGDLPPKAKYPEAVREVVSRLKSGKFDKAPEDQIANELFEIMKRNQIDAKSFFQDIYTALIGKNNGPKLASFFLAIGPQHAAEILEKAL